ncbi:5-deoxy-glucuronate isomerase [Virgibacillus sp. CBA3643]|uniref:5-deoxy-glucuronate isomerase n=1 Tax=Virgibacillus sp. CBA3643 TaxID=2942278 RepID=UPI0035A345BD
MNRLIKIKESEGYQDLLKKDNNLLDYLALGKIHLKSERTYTGKTDDYEVVLVIMSGTVSVLCEKNSWKGLGKRKNVFDGKATAVYIPCQSEYKVIADSVAEIAVCKAKAEEKHEPFVVTPDKVTVNHRGEKTWKREVHDIIAEDHNGDAQRIIVGETYNLPGSWSSYPPHKHDRANLPEEAKLEEIYHYQIEPTKGFGIQILYTQNNSIKEAHIVEHGDSFVIDRGYHPVGGLGGYKIYYLWFLGGETGRTLKPYNDPTHQWLI